MYFPEKSTAGIICQIWVVTRHQYGISALVSQTSFGGETSDSVAKCRMFSQAILDLLNEFGNVFTHHRKICGRLQTSGTGFVPGPRRIFWVVSFAMYAYSCRICSGKFFLLFLVRLIADSAEIVLVLLTSNSVKNNSITGE